MHPSEHSSGDSDPADWFSNRQTAVGFNRSDLIRFASDLRRRLAGGREFGLTIASDAAVRRANLRFRGENETTDVLSFPDGEGMYLGDILISAAQARRQALALGHPIEDELKVLLLHGLLHLLGYDHERDGGRMERFERHWRRRLRLPSGLIERAGNRHDLDEGSSREAPMKPARARPPGTLNSPNKRPRKHKNTGPRKR
jgi:probable rRNA maturation factor